jgi:hypothetical protein
MRPGEARPMDLFERYRMVGGEVHYGRVHPQYWGRILDAVKSLGARVLACYVIWDYHEVREGQYDFSQLHAFLKEVDARGFKVLARPGPFCYAEWRNLGIPDHAVPYPKHHPEFRRKAAPWIAAVLAELRPYFGRLIIALQADNEIDPMPHFYGEDQGFAAWLKQRYVSIARLNAAWTTEYTDFSEAIPTLTPFVENQRLRDGCQYRYDLATDYARWVIDEYRHHAGGLPILLNTWPGVDAQHWHDLADLADFYGIDPYPTNECRTDFRYFRERLRLLRAVTPNPYLAEFGSGIWHGMPDREYTPDHYRLTALTALASGVKGWNWYMLADRDNWHGAPINARGVLRPQLADAFRDAVRWFDELRHAPPPEVPCAVTWSWHYHQIAQIRKRDVDDPLFAVLHDMGLEYDFVDVDRDFGSPRLLLVAGQIEQPERLWHYVEGGGNLVCFQRLIDGCAPPDGTSHPGATHLESSLGFVTHAPVFSYRRVPGTPITARQLPVPANDDQRRLWDLATGRTYTTGYSQRRGAGTLLVLGCAPSAEAILAVHRFFGLDIPVLPRTRGVHATKRGSKLIVLNPGQAKTARLETGGRLKTVDLPGYGGAIIDA